MSANTGTIKITLQMDDKGSVRVIQNVGKESYDAGRKGKRAFDDMKAGAGSFSKSAQQAHTHLLKIGAVLTGGYGVARIGSDFLKTSKDFERFTLQLETITGSSAKAKASMDWIDEFAKIRILWSIRHPVAGYSGRYGIQHGQKPGSGRGNVCRCGHRRV